MPSILEGDDEAPASVVKKGGYMTNVRWCVIGAGGIADRRVIPSILSDKSNALLAIMDRNEETAKRLGAKYGVKYYTDEKQMLAENACDAVYIGTPVFCHYEQAMTALSYGANVFVEKPIAMQESEGEKLVKAFKKAGKVLFVGYMMKYHNLHRKMKKLIETERIGQITMARLQFSCWYPDITGAWRQKKTLGGGGAVMDLGVHCIELIEYLLNEEIITAKGFYSTQSFHYEVEDSGVISFRTQSGVLGHIDVNFNIPDSASESKLEIYGTKGYAICKGTLGQEEKGVLLHLYSPQGDYEAQQNRVVAKPKKYYGANGDIYLKQIQDFCKQIRQGKPDYFYAERAVQVQKIVDAVYAQKN